MIWVVERAYCPDGRGSKWEPWVAVHMRGSREAARTTAFNLKQQLRDNGTSKYFKYRAVKYERASK